MTSFLLLLSFALVFVNGYSTKEVPSHLRQRWLSDVQRERAMATIADEQDRLRSTASFVVSPNVIGSQQIVTLTWSGISNPGVSGLVYCHV